MDIGTVWMMYPRDTVSNIVDSVNDCLQAISDDVHYDSVRLEEDHWGQLIEILTEIKDADAICFCGTWTENGILVAVHKIITSGYFKKTVVEVIKTPNGNWMTVIEK